MPSQAQEEAAERARLAEEREAARAEAAEHASKKLDEAQGLLDGGSVQDVERARAIFVELGQMW